METHVCCKTQKGAFPPAPRLHTATGKAEVAPSSKPAVFPFADKQGSSIVSPIGTEALPGPSASPLRFCSRHPKGQGWTMLDPCSECIAIAEQHSLSQPLINYSPAECAARPGNNPEPFERAASFSSIAIAGPAEPVTLDVAPPPSPILACARHRRRGGHSCLLVMLA